MPNDDGLNTEQAKSDRLFDEITLLEQTIDKHESEVMALNKRICNNIHAIEHLNDRISEIRVNLAASINASDGGE